jgi:hypothetical protein
MNSALRAGTAALGVMATASLATYVVVVTDFRSGLNLIWMLGLPLLFTVAFFRRSSRWVWPAALSWLTICSFCTLAITAQILGAGP